MTWQPIETAPDDVYVLMFAIMYINANIGDGIIWVGTKDGSVETTHPISEDAVIDATHWMPLPKPPT